MEADGVAFRRDDDEIGFGAAGNSALSAFDDGDDDDGDGDDGDDDDDVGDGNNDDYTEDGDRDDGVDGDKNVRELTFREGRVDSNRATHLRSPTLNEFVDARLEN